MHHLHYVYLFSVREGKIQLAAYFYLIFVDCGSMLVILSLTSKITNLFSSQPFFSSCSESSVEQVYLPLQ